MARPNKGIPNRDPSDEALVSATLKGDRSSYRALVERHQDRLLRMVLDIVKNQPDAEDVVQESFVKAFLSLEKFKGQSSFFTWLYRIAFNMAVDLQRRAQRRGGQHFEYKEQIGVSRGVGSNSSEVEGEELPLAQNIEGPHEALVRKQTGKKLDQAFAQLSDEHRAVITLREIDGLDYEEISQALGIPRGTVMSRLFYARKMLQRALEEIAPEGAAQGKKEEIQQNGSDSRSGDEASEKQLRRAPG